MPSHKRSVKKSSPKRRSSPKRYISKRKSSVRGRRVAMCRNLKSPMACARRVDCKYVKSRKSCVRRKTALRGMKKYKSMYIPKEDVGRSFADIKSKSAEKLAMAKKALRDTLLAQQAEAEVKPAVVAEEERMFTPDELDKVFSFMIRSPKKSMKKSKSPKKAAKKSKSPKKADKKSKSPKKAAKKSKSPKKAAKKSKSPKKAAKKSKSPKKAMKKSKSPKRKPSPKVHAKLSEMDCMNVDKFSQTALKLKMEMAGAKVPKKAKKAELVEMAKKHCM